MTARFYFHLRMGKRVYQKFSLYSAILFYHPTLKFTCHPLRFSIIVLVNLVFVLLDLTDIYFQE